MDEGDLILMEVKIYSGYCATTVLFNIERIYTQLTSYRNKYIDTHKHIVHVNTVYL